MTEDEARRMVATRCGDLCELCTSRNQLTFAHRVNRSHGGGWSPSNGLRLCWPCHSWTERNPILGYAGGWRVNSNDPALPRVNAARIEALEADLGIDTSLPIDYPSAVPIPVWLAAWGGLWPGWRTLNDDGTYGWVDRDDVPTLPPWVHHQRAAAI